MLSLIQILKKISSKNQAKRKEAIKELGNITSCSKHCHIARLSLRYISEHDPSNEIRDLAVRVGGSDSNKVCTSCWDRGYNFDSN